MRILQFKPGFEFTIDFKIFNFKEVKIILGVNESIETVLRPLGK